MKQQYTIAELATKLDTLENEKRDFVLDTRKMNFEHMGDHRRGANL